ncbi:MAG: T9SS type A sorting domain-containing protein [Ignavibacteriales bacterium]|nr:T9SS type A sorting domain-containing protein [Ignavibacteriales bacterium]
MELVRRNSLLVVLLIVVFQNTLFSQKSITAYSTTIVVTDDVSPAKNLILGLDQTATDEIDLALGESELPPMPPSGNFEARFILPQNSFSGSLNSWSDFRNAAENPYTGQKTFRLHFQKTAAATYVLIKWSLPSNITGTLKDIVTGTLVNAAMSGTGELKVTNPASFNKLAMTLDFNQVSTEVEKYNSEVSSFKLLGNYPNPFNPSTVISYVIPEPENVLVRVYSSNMEYLETLHSGKQSAGSHTISWSASDYPSGLYIYSISYGNKNVYGKMMLLK